MNGPGLGRCALRLIPAAGAWLLGACASAPMERRETVELAARSPLQRAVCVRLECEDRVAERYGPAAEWLDGIPDLLRDELNVAAAVWSTDERREEDADLLVVAKVAARDPQDAEVEWQGALLDSIAWSTVPLVPWWISDVQVDPGLALEVTLHLARGNEPTGVVFQRQGEDRVLEVRRVLTCFRDRYPFFSTTTLGAIFVPPFVFEDGDPEHLAQTIREEVQWELALELAQIIKNSYLGEEELLRNLAVEDSGSGPVLVYEPAPGLWNVSVRLDGSATPPGDSLRQIIPIGESRIERRRLPLRTLLEGATGDTNVLRVDAVTRTGARLGYAIRLAGARPGAPESEG